MPTISVSIADGLMLGDAYSEAPFSHDAFITETISFGDTFNALASFGIGGRFVNPYPQYMDYNGLPYAGGFLYTYSASTDFILATFSDSALVHVNPNPIILDSRGSPGSMFLSPGAQYKFILNDFKGDQIWMREDTGTAASSFAPTPVSPPPPPPPSAYSLVFFDDSCHLFLSSNTGESWVEGVTPASPDSTLLDDWTNMEMAINDADYDNFVVLDKDVFRGQQGGVELGKLSDLTALSSNPLLNYGTIPFGINAAAIASDLGAYSSTATKIMVAIDFGPAATSLHPRVSNDGGATWSDVSGLSSLGGWVGVAFNAGATTIYIHEGNAQVWKSTDSGSTWSNLGSSPFNNGAPPPENTYRIRCNQAGTIVAIIDGTTGQWNISSNGGTTWSNTDLTAIAPGYQADSVQFADFGMTQNGSKFVAMISGVTDPDFTMPQPWVWTSTDGIAWTEVFPPYGVANNRAGATINLSQNGQCIILGYGHKDGDTMYIADVSTDFGATWTTINFGDGADILVSVYAIG